MPKVVHDLVNKLLSQKDFYPKKSHDEREQIAWGIAQIQTGHGHKHKKSDIVHGLIKYANDIGYEGVSLIQQASIVEEVAKYFVNEK